MEWLQNVLSLPGETSGLMVFLSLVKRAISLIGVLVILWGSLRAGYYFLWYCQKKLKNGEAVDLIRLEFGQAIVLGLEFIVAADVIETTKAPTYYSLGVLAGLIAIRTILSYALNHELNVLKGLGQKMAAFKKK
ncbi:MAG: hypothetical protein KR126chlam1_00164 [Chlamydiae bacterium]|nr:hypothetical protein [Chlamydiota bacterium]